MTGWIIFGGVILFFAVILTIPLKAVLEYKGQLSITARYAFFKYRILPVDEETQKKREAKKLKKEQKKLQKAKKQGKTEKPPDNKNVLTKKNLPELLNWVKIILNSMTKPVKHILKHVKLTDIAFYMAIVGDNAADTAIEVGRVNGYIYGGYAMLQNFFKVSSPDILISPDYHGKKSKIYFKMAMGLSPASAIAAVFSFAWKLLIKIIQKKFSEEKLAQS